jgi:hypothetical protein
VAREVHFRSAATEAKKKRLSVAVS